MIKVSKKILSAQLDLIIRMYGCINEYEGQKINETDEFIVINKNRYRQGRK